MASGRAGRGAGVALTGGEGKEKNHSLITPFEHTKFVFTLPDKCEHVTSIRKYMIWCPSILGLCMYVKICIARKVCK